MKRSHWKFKKKPDIHNMFGFVYVITNLQTTKKYIGCKQYWHYSKRKKTKESNWKSYTGSSALLNEDIKKLGKINFTFNIIAEFKNTSHSFRCNSGHQPGERTGEDVVEKMS